MALFLVDSPGEVLYKVSSVADHICQDCKNVDKSAFCSLKTESFGVLNTQKHQANFKKGAILFEPGDTPKGMFCIESGLVKLRSLSANGDYQTHSIFGPGDIIGLSSLLANERHQLEARTHSEATICFIPKDTIDHLARTEPSFVFEILKNCLAMLREAETKNLALTAKDSLARTSEALLYLNSKFHDYHWTRKDVAEWSGCTPETVMRNISKLKEQGVVKDHDKKIFILDRPKLLKIAQLQSNA